MKAGSLIQNPMLVNGSISEQIVGRASEPLSQDAREDPMQVRINACLGSVRAQGPWSSVRRSMTDPEQTLDKKMPGG